MVVAASGYGYFCHRQGRGSFFDKNKLNTANHSQNPRGKPGSVCFPTDTGRQIHLSAGQKPETQGQIYTGVAYQDDVECF